MGKVMVVSAAHSAITHQGFNETLAFMQQIQYFCGICICAQNINQVISRNKWEMWKHVNCFLVAITKTERTN